VPRTVADFHREVFAVLGALDVEAHIRELPSEVRRPLRFDSDTQHGSYDAPSVERFFTIVSRMDSLLERFRARFRGKCSPVQFFWGSFDLTVSRYNGKYAPERIDADSITRDAYDEEVSSVGFWPGDDDVKGAALYAYFAPEPVGFATQRPRPDGAFYSGDKRELLFMYDDVRRASDPDAAVLEFAESAYNVGAKLAGWDIHSLAYEKTTA
jgi:hypothetical protein